MHFDKITKRIQCLCTGLEKTVDAVSEASGPRKPTFFSHALSFLIELDCWLARVQVLVAQKVVSGVFAGVTTSQLDELAAETAAFMSTQHPDYSLLAARIAVSNLHKNSLPLYSEVCQSMVDYVHPKTSLPSPLLAEDVNSFVQANKDVLDNAIQHERDFE